MRQHEKESDIIAAATATVLTVPGKVVREAKEALIVHVDALEKYESHG